MHRTRSPLALGWEAARANALPALIIQALMLTLLLSYYTSHTVFVLRSQLAEVKRTSEILFVPVASLTAGALIPELFLILFFQRGRPVAGIFAICFLPCPCGDSTERLSSSCIEIKQPGLGTSLHCR